MQAFSYVDLHRNARIMGYMPDDPPPTSPDQYLLEDFRVNSRWLCNIALTCRRFAALVPEIQLHAMVLDADVPLAASGPSGSDVFTAILRLLAKPQLSRHVKQLRVHFESMEGIPSQKVLEEVLKILNSLRLPSASTDHIHDTLRYSGCGRGLFKILLALLPELQRLCIVDPWSDMSFEWAESLPIIHSLQYFKIECPEPPTMEGFGVFQQLRTFDLSIRLQGQSHSAVRASSEMFIHHSMANKTCNIKHLRLDFQIRTVGIWNHTWRICMLDVLAGFKNLEALSLYAESSAGKNPYRSVRAFPAYQANIQAYPEARPSCTGTNDFYWGIASFV